MGFKIGLHFHFFNTEHANQLRQPITPASNNLVPFSKHNVLRFY